MIKHRKHKQVFVDRIAQWMHVINTVMTWLNHQNKFQDGSVLKKMFKFAQGIYFEFYGFHIFFSKSMYTITILKQIRTVYI